MKGVHLYLTDYYLLSNVRAFKIDWLIDWLDDLFVQLASL